MDHEGYMAAAAFWTDKEADARKMPLEDLWAEIEGYIRANDVCALATGSGSFVRCTPVGYGWHDGAFWIFSEGGKKFIGLEGDKTVGLAIFEKNGGFGKLQSLQVTGRAEIVEPFSEEYVLAAQWQQVPLETLRDLPFTMHLIKVVPTDYDYLSSALQGRGYDSRQHYAPWMEWIAGRHDAAPCGEA